MPTALPQACLVVLLAAALLVPVPSAAASQLDQMGSSSTTTTSTTGAPATTTTTTLATGGSGSGSADAGDDDDLPGTPSNAAPTTTAMPVTTTTSKAGGSNIVDGYSCSSMWTDCQGCQSTGDHCGSPARGEVVCGQDNCTATTTKAAGTTAKATTSVDATAGATTVVVPPSSAAPSATTTTTTTGNATNATGAVLPTMGLVLHDVNYKEMNEIEVLELKIEIIKQVVHHSSGLLAAEDVERVDLALVAHAGNSSDAQQQQHHRRRRANNVTATVSTAATVVFKEGTAKHYAAAAVLINDAIQSDQMVLTYRVRGTEQTFVVQQSMTLSNAVAPTVAPVTTLQPPVGDADDDNKLSAGVWAAITVVLVGMVAVAAAATVYHARQAQRAQSGTRGAVRRGSAELRKDLDVAGAKAADTAGLVDGARDTPSFYEEQAFTGKEEGGQLGVKSVRRENPSYGLQYTQ